MEQTVFPHLTVTGASDALDWYVKAFGATELVRMPAPDGRIMHAAFEVFGNRILLNDDFPDMDPEHKSSTPKALGGTAVTIHMYVPEGEDLDAFFDRAVAAGATVKLAPADMFWGDRYAQFYDPWGHRWALGKTVKKMTPQEQMDAVRTFRM